MEWRETRRKENTTLWGKKKKIFGQRDDLIIFPIVRCWFMPPTAGEPGVSEGMYIAHLPHIWT